jgi:hypothetical protein
MTTAEIVGDSGSLSTFTTAGRAEKDNLSGRVLETLSTSKELVKDELVRDSLDVFRIHLERDKY